MSPDRRSEAEAELREALKQVGLRTTSELSAAGERPDLVVVSPGGLRSPVDFIWRALVTERELPQLLRAQRHDTTRECAHVVVADRVTERAREELRVLGWGWLDLRGHLHLEAPGLFIDALLTPSVVLQKPSKDPLAGRVGLELATLLLIRPHTAWGVRAAATELGRAPSSVSQEMARLRDAGLVDAAHRPVLPDLFHALARRWRPESVDVAGLPRNLPDSMHAALHLGLDKRQSQSGWALGDSLAAVAYGAPLHVSKNHPPDLYVPDRATLRRAIHLLGTASSHEDRAGTLRLAEVEAVCSSRVDEASNGHGPWPLVHPLFVALDLAQDPGRGADVLESWVPPEPWQRVW